jgi:hypothetical protein
MWAMVAALAGQAAPVCHIRPASQVQLWGREQETEQAIEEPKPESSRNVGDSVGEIGRDSRNKT